MKFSKARRLSGELTIPGDKSISHRSIMFGSIAQGLTEVRGFLQGADCLSTISCFTKMGIPIENKGETVLIHGRGLRGLTAPKESLDCGNSGTTTRLICGILAAQDFDVTLTGDESICRRPMKRIMEPLSMMGAKIRSIHCNDCAPLAITGCRIHGIHYQSPVASAQVKSAVLLAGLYAEGETRVTESYISRNALIVPNSEVLIRNVGINPTRDGILHVCRQMNGNISILNRKNESGEPTADLLVRSSALQGTVIEGSIIPTLIDELPMLAAMACYAKGTTVIRDAAELKVKESNRITVMAENLRAMGADVTETADGMIIHGGRPLHGAVTDSKKDHRIAMTFAVTALAAEGETEILDADCVNISYPGFYSDLARLKRE